MTTDAWMVRAGEYGEREQVALDEGCAMAGWDEVGDLAAMTHRDDLRRKLEETHPRAGKALIANWTGQLWRFSQLIRINDYVLMPLKADGLAQIAVGRCTGSYVYAADASPSQLHRLPVDWLRCVPRGDFGGDLLDSLGALLTVCQISRHNAAERIALLAHGGADPGWQPSGAMGLVVEDREAFLTRALDEGTSEPLRLTVRKLIAFWGFSRRTDGSVQTVLSDLAESGLTVNPEITAGWLDDLVEVRRLAHTPGDGSRWKDPEIDEKVPDLAVTVGVKTLKAATGGVISVLPQDTVRKAVSLMLRHDYSQLPVIDSKNSLKGDISWESLGKAQLAGSPTYVRQATATTRTVRLDDDLLSVVDGVIENDFVFVCDATGEVVGLVTVTDLSVQFDFMSRPFTLIEEVERRLRRRVDEVFSVEQMCRLTNNRRVEGAANLSFGNYHYLFKDEDAFQLLAWSLDHSLFLEWIEEIRRIRNDLMHFSTDPLEEHRLQLLQQVVYVLRTVDPRV